MAQNNAVAQAILSVTSNVQVQAAMLLGAHMESGWNASAVGDQGTSFGPFQIHLPAHPGVSSSQAENPSWAAQYMLGTYESAVAKVPAGLWGSDPSRAAALAAYYAERPAKMYSASQISSGWPAVQAALGGNSAAIGTVTGTPGTSSGGVQQASLGSSILGPIQTDATTALNEMYMGFVILAGVFLMGFGAVLLFRDAFKTSAAPTVINVKEPRERSTPNVKSDKDSGTGEGPSADARPRTTRATRGSGPRIGHPTRGTVINPRTSPGRKQPTVKRVEPAKRKEISS